MKKIALAADDYTGAADAGVYLLATGQAVTLVLPGADSAHTAASLSHAIAINSETRFLPPAEAAKVVHDIASSCRQAGFDFFFKKIDSTLRGNPGAETAAVLNALDLSGAVACPAFPALGRTCIDGIMLVHGIPLIETEIARDRFTPLSSSRPAEILTAQTGLPSGHLPLGLIRSGSTAARAEIDRLLASGIKLIVADSVTDADLDALAAIIVSDPRLLPVGSGGLSRACSEALAGKPADAPPPYRMRGRVLAVMGSLTSNTDDQIEHALSQGSFSLVVLDFDRGRADCNAEVKRAAGEAKRSLGKHLILITRPKNRDGDASFGLAAGRMLGQAAECISRECGCRILFSTGGATSAALCAEFGLKRIVLERELFPGTVAGHYLDQKGEKFWFVSKAGGFGGKETLSRLLRFVE
ncbi:MAG: four-carbon acid sugar kinase family protein [Planctomycetes bacterium]|nr:four-carbon acid sugar kinase family protein [Planctomycetota bacterium]